MTSQLLWILASLLTGSVWGAIATVFVGSESAVRYAVVFSPVLGVFMAVAIRPLREVDWGGAAIMSAVGLYGAAALFGLTAGIAGMIQRHTQLDLIHLLLAPLGSVGALWWGLTFSGLVLLLWPLSFANHALIWWLQRRADDLKHTAK